MARKKEGKWRGEREWEAVKSADAAAAEGLQLRSFVSAVAIVVWSWS